jgi:hypothetical protein
MTITPKDRAAALPPRPSGEGAYRRVYALGAYVVKRATGAEGCRMNMREWQRYHSYPGLPLAPCVRISSDGQFLVQRRVKMLACAGPTTEESGLCSCSSCRAERKDSRPLFDGWLPIYAHKAAQLLFAGVHHEPKTDSYGWLGDQLVCVDYGDTELQWSWRRLRKMQQAGLEGFAAVPSTKGY